MNKSIFKVSQHILIFVIMLMAFSSCHLFKQERYQMFNGMKFHTFALENGLEVLAISDKRFVKSSAALSVMAGSMQNPDEHLGLAHFLEHMLFLGTKEFPQVGDYEDFLNKNGGGHNAYTSIDHTNYFFDVDHRAYEEALKKFSRFFVSPTFDEKYVEREKNAVNSEHEKNLEDDGRREHRFQQLTTDPNHPFSKFATGDKNTLSKANREIVMNFYKNHYSSNLMRLVMMSDDDPEVLEKLAKENFSDIVNKKLPQPEFSDELFKGIDLPRFHQVQTVRDRDTLKVSFDIPDNLPYWESKPTIFLAHLLGDEGEGSLLSYLKKKGLALELGTSSWWRMFNIRVTMTEKGKANHKEILKAIFSYIKLLKKEGLKEYLFKERQLLSKVELENIEPKSSMGRASNYSASMLYYPVKSFLSQHYLYHKYSQEDFDTFLKRLNTDNMQVTLLSNDVQVSEKEKYYGIAYKTEKMEKDFIKALDEINIYSELMYPGKNIFVPTNLDLVQAPKLSEPKVEKYKGDSKLYYQVDTSLEIPKGSFGLSFVSDVIKGDPLKYILAKLFVIIKREELNEWGYPARLAGLNYSINHGNNTISVDVSGYSQHLDSLLTKLIYDEETGRKIDHTSIDQELFKKIKNKLKKNILNREFDAAYEHLMYEFNIMVSTGSVHRNEYIKYIDSITLDQINEFAENFFNRVAIRSYSYGNINHEKIKSSIDMFLKKISKKTFSEEEVETFESKYVQLPNKKAYFAMKGKNNNNAQITFYRSGDWNIKSQAYSSILSKIMEQPYFTELRTHQQLGYIVTIYSSASNGYSGVVSLIQSESFETKDIYERSDRFVKEFFKQLSQKLEDKEIDSIKSALINEISKDPNTLGERHSRFSIMASAHHGDFDFFNKLIKEIKGVDAAGLKKYVKESWLDNKDLSQFVMLYSGAGSKEEVSIEGFEKVPDLKEFKEKQPKIHPYKRK